MWCEKNSFFRNLFANPKIIYIEKFARGQNFAVFQTAFPPNQTKQANHQNIMTFHSKASSSSDTTFNLDLSLAESVNTEE